MQQHIEHPRGGGPGTLSVAVRDPDTGALGVAITTGLVSAGAYVPFVSHRAAVLTQSFTNVSIGRNALALVENGLSFPMACKALLTDDPHSNYRQVHGIDSVGRTFVHTGSDCVEWSGHLTDRNYTVAGNMLVGSAVVEAMGKAIQSTEGPLIDRLIASLHAGADAGGDKRGSVSAAVLIDAPEYHLWHDLRVDYDVDPVGALETVYDQAVEMESSLAEDTAELLGEYPPSIIGFERRWAG